MPFYSSSSLSSSPSHCYLAYLHSLGFSHKRLFQIFGEGKLEQKQTSLPVDQNCIFSEEVQEKKYEHFFKNFKYADLQGLHMKEDEKQEIIKKRDRFFEKASGKKYSSAQYIDLVFEKKQVAIIDYNHKNYPEALKNTPNSPFCIYVRGSLPPTTDLLGVVGSRKHSLYAKQAIQLILPEIIQTGFGIISGGATGIDTLGHTLAREYRGYTCVIFGTGIDGCYPVGNHTLYEELVCEGSGIISSFPVGMPGNAYTFPVRNEYIAALSKGILVAEAQEKSGTLITARLGLEGNKDIFVIPSDITRSNGIGSNALIRDGLGKLITCAQDILDEYNLHITPSSSEQILPKDDFSCEIYKFIQKSPSSLDTLHNHFHKDISELKGILAILEIEGFIKVEPGNIYWSI